MKLRIKVQRHIVIAYRADDSGEWVVTVCRAGMGDLLGRHLVTGEELIVEMDAKESETPEDLAWLHKWLYPQSEDK